VTIGRTIHDEAVAVVSTARGWAVELDGERLGRVELELSRAMDRALGLVPPARRTERTFARFGDLGWLSPASVELEHRWHELELVLLARARKAAA
jgi:hypothetical protein